MNQTTPSQPAPLSGLHLLLTYECNFQCDHCFVWSGPSQGGTMTADGILEILQQGKALGSIEWIYFEGGEPSLYYELLSSGVQLARDMGFSVGMVTNASWAETEKDALEWLGPFSGVVEDLSISDDAYHGSKEGIRKTHIARKACRKLGIPVDFITVSGKEILPSKGLPDQPPAEESTVLYRGRAAGKLAPYVQPKTWERYTECPWEELRHPERVHVDAYGNLHICQGISIGNLFESPLTEIISTYDPDNHPVIGPLLAGGPAELVERYQLPHLQAYADECHLCYTARCQLRNRFPECLTPAQMYGNISKS